MSKSGMTASSLVEDSSAVHFQLGTDRERTASRHGAIARSELKARLLLSLIHI